MTSTIWIFRCATVVAVLASLAGCHPVMRTRPAAAPEISHYDMAIIKLPYDGEVAGFVDTLDGAEVAHYLRGLGARPTLPEIGVEPGLHTINIGYFNVKTGAVASETASVTWSAQPGHLYEIRIAPRSLLSKASAVLVGDPHAMRAWVDDKGPVDGNTVLWWQAPPPNSPLKKSTARSAR